MSNEIIKVQDVKNVYNDFESYCKYMVPLINGKYEWASFHKYIMDRIDFYIKQGYGRLIIEMPPQLGKSLIAGTLLPTYYLAKYPNNKILYATYNDNRAEAMLTDGIYPILFGTTKETEGKYSAIFPHVKFKFDLDEEENTTRNKKIRKSTALLNNKFNILGYRGGMLAIGAGSGVSGYASHLTIIDDYFGKYEDAQSDTIREKVTKWWRADIKMRAQPDTLEITFCTRWHSEDIIGMIRKDIEENTDPDYVIPEIITFPAQKELEDMDNLYDTRQVGEYLWDIYKSKFADAKKDPLIWACVMQQKPINAKGMLLNAEDLIEWKTHPGQDNIYISVDTNMKAAAEKGDKTSIQVWQVSNPNKYLIDLYYIKTNFVELVQLVMDIITNKYPHYSALLIETRANGQALVDLLKTKFPRVIGIEPQQKSQKNINRALPSGSNQNSKADRMQMCLPEFKAHNVYIPPSNICPGIIEFRRQLINFTGAKGKVDDHADACSLFLNYVRNHIIVLPSNQKIITQGNMYNDIIAKVIDNDDDDYLQDMNLYGSNPTGYY